MYNVKNSNNYSGYYVGGGIFFFMGLIVSIVFFCVFYLVPIIYDSHAPVKDYIWMPAEDNNYKPIIEFEYEGEIHECRPNISSSDKFKIKNVYFKEDNLTDCSIDFKEGLGKAIYIILVIPVIFLLLGLGLIIKGIGKHKKNKRLRTDGILVKNIDCHIQPITSYNNGRRYYRIQADYTFPDGTTKKLRQTILSNKKIENNKCDLLYLLEDYNVYCLDFDIEYQSYTF